MRLGRRARVYENGAIRTGSVGPVYRALVTDGESVAHLGSVEECRAFAPAAERIDLAGGYVVPGMIDSHVHAVQIATQRREIDLSHADSASAVVAAVRAVTAMRDGAAESAAGGGPGPSRAQDWLLGGGWNWSNWPDKPQAKAATLDRVTGRVPVALHAADLHTYWLNTAAIDALTAAGVLPQGGEGASAALVGVVSEDAAFRVQRYLESVVESDLTAEMRAVLERFLSHGVTGIHDIDNDVGRDAFERLHRDHALPLRVHKLTPYAEMADAAAKGIRAGSGDRWMNYGAVKVFADGSLGSHTAHLHSEYPGTSGDHGVQSLGREEMVEIIRECGRNGFNVAVHAIGDAAVSDAVAAFRATAEHKRTQLPNRIEHFQHARPEDVRAFASLDAMACMQPSSCTSDLGISPAIMGDTGAVSYGWQSMLTAGVRVAFSSDAPVESVNPFDGMYAAVTRRLPEQAQRSWQPEECLTRRDAFDCYTRSAAVLSGEQATRGTLAVGALADFAVLDRDPFSVSEQALRDTRVEMTAVGAEITWTRQQHQPHER